MTMVSGPTTFMVLAKSMSESRVKLRRHRRWNHERLKMLANDPDIGEKLRCFLFNHLFFYGRFTATEQLRQQPAHGVRRQLSQQGAALGDADIASFFRDDDHHRIALIAQT